MLCSICRQIQGSKVEDYHEAHNDFCNGIRCSNWGCVRAAVSTRLDRAVGCDRCHAVLAGTARNGRCKQPPHAGNGGPVTGVSDGWETLRRSPSARRLRNTIQQVASVTGHSLKTVTSILEKYLARTRGLSDAAITNFENSPRTDFANQLQTTPPGGKARTTKLIIDNGLDGAPEEIRTPDP